MGNLGYRQVLVAALIAVMLASFALAHGGSDGVIVRVTGYDPASNIYNFSCLVPNKTAASNIADLKFYDIDPTPSYYPSRHNFRSADSNFTWHLDPDNFEEEVHTNAMYHMYCEAQNFSAPPEKQNLASEFHIDLRKTHNQDDPNIYVLDSEGPRVTLKCDPPPGTKRFSLAWGLRNREGMITFPALANQRIVNITAPKATAGWDITCDVFDKDKGKTFHWDMPVEFFESGPAYIPTIEGCVAHEPCTWVSQNGILPNGSITVNVTLNSTPAQANIFVNEKFKGMTGTNGLLTMQNIMPGIYNLAVRKEGYDEISTLIPIAAGKELQRSYAITENSSDTAADACHSTVFGMPVSCSGGMITNDDVSSGCRQIICSNATGNMRVLACNKPTSTNPEFFEMYRQAQNGTAIKQICIGSTCIKDSGFAKSPNFPICTGNASSQALNGSLRVSTIPNFADVHVDNALRGNSGLMGSIMVDNLVPGMHSLLVRKTNYTDNLSTVSILSGQITDVQAKLGQTAQNTPDATNSSNSTIPGTTCYSSLQNMPANCTGGTITQDTFAGGRTIVCSNGVNNMRVQAWEKPDSGIKQYFEIYKQAQTGPGFEICIGKTCMKDQGYARSENYPICFSTTPVAQNGTLNLTTLPNFANVFLNGESKGTTDINGRMAIPNLAPASHTLLISKTGFNPNTSQITIASGQTLTYLVTLSQSSDTNSTQTNSTACYSSLNDIPANCTGGTITQDTFAGGRNILCTNGGDSLQIQAWEKPDSGTKQYFEMYRQSKTGILVKEICIGSTCIKDNGYSRSLDYPICLGSSSQNNATQQQNATLNITTNPAQSNVFIDGLLKGMTNTDGNLVIINMIPGTHSLLVSKSGYNNFTDSITLNQGQKLSLFVGLTPVTSSTPNKVYVRVVSANPATRTYTFSCRMNPENSFLRDWFIRPDDGNLNDNEPEEATFLDRPSGEFLTYTFKNNTFYHLGCLVVKEPNFDVVYRGDMHIDLRNANWNPEIFPISGNGLSATYECRHSSPNYGASWEVVNAQTGQVSSLGSGKTISHTASMGLFDYICHITDNTNGQQHATGLPVEYFAQGNPYFPDNQGVPDGIKDVWVRSSGTSQPQAPVWLEPSQNKPNVDPFDFHLQVFPMTDSDNDEHIASDFEIWDDAINQRAWSALNTQVLTHIHNADGVFENSLAGKTSLAYDSAYRVRARFYDNGASNTVSEWSELRFFRTKPEFTVASNFSWTAQPGFKVERVAANISFPVNIGMAPPLYSHLPAGEQPLLYVTQLYGQVGMIKKNGQYVQYAGNLLNYIPGSLPGTGESGIDGIYVDEVTGDLFVSLVYMNSSNKLVGKVVRFVTNNDGNGYVSNMTILDKIPVDFSHQVHTITRGPDGKLYLSTGDANSLGGASLDQSKDPAAMSGKILRFNDDGSKPADNPYPGTYTYAGGFRNPFGHAWRPGTSELFVTNNGPDSDDGVYKANKGDIFGWCCNTATGTWHLWKNTTAPTQAVFNDGASGFPAETQGSLFVALSGPTYKPGPDKEGKRIVKLTVMPDGSKGAVEDFVVYTGTGYSAPIGLAFGDDGLYFTDIYGKLGIVDWPVTNGNVYRVVQGIQTEDPEGSLGFTAALGPKAWYPKGLDVVWECKVTGGSGNYRWDFEFGDGQKQFDWTQDNVQHVYPAPGTYTAKCTVRDMTTLKSATAQNTITLTNS